MLAVSLLLSISCDEKISEPEVIAVTRVSLNKMSVALTEGDEIALTATVEPSNATNKNVTWESSHPDVAIVSDGNVIALRKGVTTIIVTTEDGNKTARCGVRVVAETVPVSGIWLDKNSAEMYVGDKITLNANVAPENATDKTVIWTSSDTDVATVKNGNVTALSVGYTTITAKAGKHEVKCYITVKPVDVISVTLDKTSVSLLTGESIALTATVLPENATDKIVTWFSSDNNVATVSDGKVTAMSVGKATVTARVGNVKAECSVTVNSIEVTSVILEQTSITLLPGDSVTLTATVLPDNATDKTVTWSSSDNSVITVSNGIVTAVSVGKATVTAWSGNVKAECSFTVNPIEVTSITLDLTSTTLLAGESLTLTATVFPENATDKTVTWSSSDNNVATVSDGKVIAMSVGKATITAQIGNVKADCLVTVNPTEVVSITLDKSSVILAPDESVTLNATVLPDNATDKTIIWSSSNNGVATVTNGIVTAISVGKATITAKTSNGLYATILVDVINKPQAGGSEGTGEIEW